jgi:putative transposase
MLCLVKLLLVPVIMFFRSRRDLLLENLALRQQLAVFETKAFSSSACCSQQTFLGDIAAFLVRWRETLILVQPQTVVRWHRAGFRLYWTWLSRHPIRAGRKCVSAELRELIFRMVADNPTWGSPRIHGELKMLSFDISERTVLRWMRKSATEFGSGKAMGGVSEQSSGSHRCDGFLYRADAGVRRALLLLRHRA